MESGSKNLINFLSECLKFSFKGNLYYRLWLSFLVILMGMGFYLYLVQLDKGLIVTGMTDYVSWGLYISNFTFLVGLAAAAVMIVIPAYLLSDYDFYNIVLVGEGVAVGALFMCLLFVTADMGGPHRLWHLIPMIGVFNWPQSLLTWDVIVLNVYLAINFFIPFYILYSRYNRKIPSKKVYLPFILISIFWAFMIHLVTAFLYAGLSAKPFWNNSLMGPRFLASAFAAGPAFIVVLLGLVDRFSPFIVAHNVIKKLSQIVTVAAIINIIMLFSEVFKEFYNVTEHSLSAVYLFFGLGEHSTLVPWLWTSIFLNVLATIILCIPKFRNKAIFLYPSCILLFVAIWIEKGMGLVVPGFIPSPLGEVVEYTPTLLEVGVTVSIWAAGLFVISLLVRVGHGVEQGFITKQTSN
ncbi:MAG: polysulfide reductase NrfD [Halobacteriovoraceae bacterium]|nr:polysulfide reductase NrfD [Halobacteriovoraceae bacterium]